VDKNKLENSQITNCNAQPQCKAVLHYNPAAVHCRSAYGSLMRN